MSNAKERCSSIHITKHQPKVQCRLQTYDDEKTTPYNIYQSEAVTKIATNIDTMAVDLQKKSFGNPACSSYSILAKISEQFF